MYVSHLPYMLPLPQWGSTPYSIKDDPKSLIARFEFYDISYRDLRYQFFNFKTETAECYRTRLRPRLKSVSLRLYSQKSVSVLRPRVRLGNSWWSRPRLTIWYEHFSRPRPLETDRPLDVETEAESLADLWFHVVLSRLDSRLPHLIWQNLRH